MKYRKKPVVIDAIQWNGNNLMLIYNFMGKVVNLSGDWRNHDRFYGLESDYIRNGMPIDTLEGRMIANVGDYVIKGINGEFYPCKPDIFEATYERVEE